MLHVLLLAQKRYSGMDLWVFSEMSSFEAGTKGVAMAVASNKEAETITIGGGDSVAASEYSSMLGDQMTFISTGGGASMELVQGEALPGVEAL